LDSDQKQVMSGSGQYADLAIFSFHPVKHIAAGEGGMITTNNEELYQKILNLRTHGIQQDPSNRIYDDSLWYYEMQELGYNYRLTDMQAALGRSQLSRADEGLSRSRELANRYFDFFKNKSYVLGQSGVIEGHAYHLYVLEVKQRKELHKYLRDLEIFAQIHYIPAHLMPYYRQFGWKEGDLPNAEKYYSQCISIPMFPSLSDEEQRFVMDKIDDFYNG
jgi:dTDP-4-amino-4,6-dideoxygalactose transaminase